MNHRYFTIRRAVMRWVQKLLKRLLSRIERQADFDPLVWAAADGGELRMTVDPCTAQWEIHIKVKPSGAMDTYEAYQLDEVAVVVSGQRMRDAIDAVCLQHCQKNDLLP